ICVGQPDKLRQILGRTEDRQMLELRTLLARLVVDKPNEVQSVLGVLKQLLRDPLPDLAGADDDRVLDVADMPAAETARDGTTQRHEHDRHSPEEEDAF